MIDTEMMDEIQDRLERYLSASRPAQKLRRRKLRKQLESALEEYGDEARFELFDFLGEHLQTDHYDNDRETYENVLTEVINKRFDVSGVFEMQEYVFNKYAKIPGDEAIVARTMGKIGSKKTKSLGGTFLLTNFRLVGFGWNVAKRSLIPILGVGLFINAISSTLKELSHDKMGKSMGDIFQETKKYGHIYPIYQARDISQKKARIRWSVPVKGKRKTKYIPYTMKDKEEFVPKFLEALQKAADL